MQLHSTNHMRGFTLVETVVVITLTTIVGLALNQAIVYFYRTNAYVLEGTAAIASARSGVTTLGSNLREATYGDDGAYPIASPSSTSLTFYADVDKDGGVERVMTYLTGNTLYRSVTNAAGNPASYTGQTATVSTLATDVRNGSVPLFRYFNENGVELTGTIDVTEIASVTITLMIDINPNRAPDIYTLSQSATLRNLLSE